ncbi:MAG TPA: hypothetical protein VF281_00320 [Candidatus Saccharimonadales bacterium]
MGEYIPPESSSQTFNALERLEQLDHDDYLATMWRKVDAVEEMLQRYSIDAPDSALLLTVRQDLDRDWRYMGYEVAVSGRIITDESWNESMGVPEYETTLIENDEKLVSMGFAVLPYVAVYEDEISTQYKVALTFGRNGRLCRMLRENFIGRFPGNQREIAERRLTYHHHDEVMRIQERLNNTEQPSVMSFRDYQLSVYMHARYNENYVSDVETYLYDRLNFDTEVPYLVTGMGDDDEMVTIVARPERIEMIPLTDDEQESPRRHVPHLHLTRFGVTPQNKSTRVRVPFGLISAMQSLRTASDSTVDGSSESDYNI